MKIPTIGAKPNESNAVDHRAAGDNYRDQKQWSEAVKAYSKYLRQAPNDFAIWVQLGNCLKEDGRIPAALDAYDKAAALNANDGDVYLQKGHALKLLGDLASALKAYEISAALDPQRGDAQHEISEIISRFPAIARLSQGANSELPRNLEEIFEGVEEDKDIFQVYFSTFEASRSSG
jgi:tetratricopeptide (TPR) repeat protein